MDIYRIETKLFGTITGSDEQIRALRNAIQSDADKSYDRAMDKNKPEPVRAAWLDYWNDCLDELNRFDEQYSKAREGE